MMVISITNKSFGIVLFTSITISLICLTNSNIIPSSIWKTFHTRFTKKSKKIITLSTSCNLSSGILVQLSSNDMNSNDWRNLVSHNNNGDDNVECELEITNNFDETILLCWISEDGKLHNYYPIDNGSIKDGSVSNTHLEFTEIGHSFVCLRKIDNKPKTINDITKESFLFLYQPSKSFSRHKVIITSNKLKHSEPIIDVSCVDISKEEIIDSTSKIYVKSNICGFSILSEPNVFEVLPDLEKCLKEDLVVVNELVPSNLLRRLQNDTCIWINESISYGKKSNPIVGKACTYHPTDGQLWLQRMGLTTEKAGSIEMFSAESYLKDRIHWSIGGILVHELSHCIHDKYLTDGFNNKTIQDCYSKAMSKLLYHEVTVHGPQGKDGKKIKAYACTNCMEFFAELSVAYLYDKDKNVEYNKWFPHNRFQLIEYDIDTYNILNIVWSNMENEAIEYYKKSK